MCYIKYMNRTTYSPAIEAIGERIVRAIQLQGLSGDEAEDLALDLLDHAREEGLDLSDAAVDRIMAYVDDNR